MAKKYGKKTRVRIAVAKYYGLDGEEQSYEQISDELGVSTKQVKRYIHETSVGAEAEKMLAQKEAQARFQIYEKLSRKLEHLEQIEEELLEKKDIAPSSYKLESATGMVAFDSVPNVQADPKAENVTFIEQDVPVPDDFVEVSDVGELKDVWREQRQVIEQMEDLLGLEEPEQIEETSQQIVDVKHWSMDGADDNLPDQEVVELESDTEEVAGELPDAEVVDE
jgi:transposase